MIPNTFEYSAPASLSEALGLIASGGKPLGGGMSLIPMMKLRLAAPEHLVNVGALAELNYIKESSEGIHIGAGCTHYTVESSTLLMGKCPLIAETAAYIGDIQVRNMGTLGGAVAHADPAADYPAALQALEATIVLQSAKGERKVSAAKFFVDTFTTALKEDELVTEVIVPVEAGLTGTSYQKFLQPASGFAIVGIAARARREDGNVSLIRVGVTGLSGNSFRASGVEAALLGTAGSDADIQAAAALVTKGADAGSDLHASAEYRAHLAQVYTARAIAAALSRAA
jgi:carbon-monoxide dehydrogenase medium subunit